MIFALGPEANNTPDGEEYTEHDGAMDEAILPIIKGSLEQAAAEYIQSESINLQGSKDLLKLLRMKLGPVRPEHITAQLQELVNIRQDQRTGQQYMKPLPRSNGN